MEIYIQVGDQCIIAYVKMCQHILCKIPRKGTKKNAHTQASEHILLKKDRFYLSYNHAPAHWELAHK